MPFSAVTAFAATAPAHRRDTEDMVAAALRFSSGAIGSLTAANRSTAAARPCGCTA